MFDLGKGEGVFQIKNMFHNINYDIPSVGNISHKELWYRHFLIIMSLEVQADTACNSVLYIIAA
jgi:hypothetical protein